MLHGIEELDFDPTGTTRTKSHGDSDMALPKARLDGAFAGRG